MQVENKKNTYMEFHRENISSEIPLIRDIPDVLDGIEEYLALRIEEMEEGFEAEEAEDMGI